MALHMRKFDPNADDSRIRLFLRDVFLCHDRHAVSWPLYRWDYWRWHINLNIHQFNLEAAIFLWETGRGNLAAFLNPCHPGEACLQVHPEFDTPELTVEMMTTAETQFATHLPEGGQTLTIWCPSTDRQRQDILTRRGYIRSDRIEIHYRHKLAKLTHAISPLTGYTLRSLHSDEVSARSWLAWKTAHPHESETHYPGWEWYFNVQRAPLYDRSLDLVAETATGELAAYCTVWIDEPTQTAAIEPLGTHPAHRHSKLVQALLSQGLQCALSRGATLGIITAYDQAAAKEYAAAGFTPTNLSQAWIKNWA